MAPARPMLDGVELPQTQRIASEDDEVLAQHGVPALEGDFLQDLGRRAVRVTLTGVMSGAESGDDLKGLREKFHAAEPVSFVADIATATRVDKVLIEEMGVRELAGRPERFEYALALREYILPPAVTEESPPVIPVPPVPLTATLVVEVIVEGDPNFDFSRVTVTVSGTDPEGTSVSRTLANRAGNTWTETDFPPGQYTAEAVVTDPEAMTGSAPAEVREGETTQVTITLQAGATIAKRFIVHFWFDKAFVEPCMREVLQRVGDYSNAHPNEKMLIVGHTDLVGDERIPSSGIRYNQSLSERRARAVFAVMTFGRDRTAALTDWNELRRTQTGGVRTLKDSWGTREYQYMLQDLGYYAGMVNEIHDGLTIAAIRDFQRDNQARGLTPTGTMNDLTWSVLIETYLDRNPPAIPEARFLPNSSAGCDGGILKWLGCEEQDPVRNTEDAWRPNRRVELLFVRTDRLPCQQPQPDTFDLPAPGAVSPSWCLGPGNRSQRVCFVTPALPSSSGGSAGAWSRQPAEPGTVTVRGRIARADDTPLANARFVLIAPDGLYLHTDPSGAADLGEVARGSKRGRPILNRANANGEFSFPDPTPVGTYILEIQEPVVARLADDPGLEAKGNVVCKRMDGTSDFNVLVCGAVATTFELEVTDATRVGGAGSNVFVATRASVGDVLITAVTPSGTCAAPRSITWTGGLEVQDHPLQRRVPRANAGQTTVTAVMSPGGVTRSVDIFIVRVTLDVDADRDGVVEVDGTGKNDWEFGAGLKGAVLLCNCDDDDGNHQVDRENLAVDGTGDADDLAPLVVRQSGPLPPGVSLVLTANRLDKIRIFNGRLATSTPVLGPGSALPSELVVIGTQAADVDFGIEGLAYPNTGFDGVIRLTLLLMEGAVELARDDVAVRVAPWVMPSHLQETQELYVVEIGGFNTAPVSSFMDRLQAAATAAGVPLRRASGATYRGDPWMQDTVEIGYTRMPGKQIPAALNALRPRGLNPFARRELLAADYGVSEALTPAMLAAAGTLTPEVPTPTSSNSFDSHGNLEVSPPVAVSDSVTGKTREFKLGRIYFGGQPRRVHIAGGTFVNDVVFNQEVRAFLEAQRVQSPFSIDTSWLAVGHVDEIISFVPAVGGKGFKMLLASPAEGMGILRVLRARGSGSRLLFEGKSDPPFDERSVADVVTDTALVNDNNFCQTRLNAVRDRMRAELGLDLSDIVEVPSLFMELESSPRRTDPAADPQFVALMPGMVNLLVITKPNFADTRLLIPKPFGPELTPGGGDVFEQDLIRRLTPLGYSASQIRFVDDFDNYHINDGEVHCGTNSKRAPHATPWWEQVDT